MNPAPVSKSNFIFEKIVGADDAMVEFAKMVILLAFEEYPDNDWDKSNLVANKFEQKYGNEWLASFIKNGDCRFHYHGYFLKLKYKDNNIKIARTGL